MEEIISTAEAKLASVDIQPTLINPANFLGMRNYLTSEYLIQLSKQCDDISIPERCGEFENADAFQQAVNFFIQSSYETRHRGLFLKTRNFTKLTRQTTFFRYWSG